MHVLAGHLAPVSCVEFSPAGDAVATGSFDRTVRLWDSVSGACYFLLREHTRQVFCLSFSPTGRHLASGSSDTTIKIWSVATGEQKFTLRDLGGKTGPIRSIAWSPDGMSLATCTPNGEVRVWAIYVGRFTHILRSHTAEGICVAYAPDGRALASCATDHTVKLWQLKPDRSERWSVKRHGALPVSVKRRVATVILVALRLRQSILAGQRTSVGASLLPYELWLGVLEYIKPTEFLVYNGAFRTGGVSKVVRPLARYPAYSPTPMSITRASWVEKRMCGGVAGEVGGWRRRLLVQEGPILRYYRPDPAANSSQTRQASAAWEAVVDAQASIAAANDSETFPIRAQFERREEARAAYIAQCPARAKIALDAVAAEVCRLPERRFMLQIPFGKAYEFRCTSENETDHWVRSISEAIGPPAPGGIQCEFGITGTPRSGGRVLRVPSILVQCLHRCVDPFVGPAARQLLLSREMETTERSVVVAECCPDFALRAGDDEFANDSSPFSEIEAALKNVECQLFNHEITRIESTQLVHRSIANIMAPLTDIFEGRLLPLRL